jgi:hypothetical protein
MINICLKKSGQLPQLWFRFYLGFQMLSQECLLITFLGNDKALRHKQVYIYTHTYLRIYVQSLM